MQEQFGVMGNWHDGVFFTEGAVQGAVTNLGAVSAEISRQNANLTEVKSQLAAQAKRKGANVIQQFTYGQKAHKWWEQVFTLKWDTESWHGSGQAVSVR